jgi:hypothetical protein
MSLERGDKSRKLSHLHGLKKLRINKRFHPYEFETVSVERMKKEQGSNMRKVKTHFEQVPVEVVKKKIAVERQQAEREQEAETEQESDENETRSPNLVVETPATKTEPYSVSSSMFCRNAA